MKKIIPVIILTIISAFLIFYRFVEIPKYLAYDEVEFTKLALSLDNKSYIPYSELATGHSTLYFYIILLSLKTFGINVFALRLPAAIFGILCVLLFYLIMKKVFQQLNNGTMKQLFPFFLTLTFLTSRWFLNFSRFSFEATFLLFLELVSIYFLLKFSEVSKAKISSRPGGIVSSFYIIFSGIFAGLAFLSYTPGRIFFLLPIGLLILKRYRQGIALSVLLFLIPFVIIIVPLTTYLMTNQESRIDKLFFWKNHEMTINEKIIGTASNIGSISLMFFTKGDMNGKHNYPGKPALNSILGILFIIGLIISIKNFKNLYNKIFLFYFLISLIPALMIYPWENPNMLRTYTVLPSVIYFIGNAIIILETAASKIIVNKKIFITCFLFLVILFSCLYELRSYFKYQAPVFEHSFEIKHPLKKAIKMKNVYEKIP